MFNIALAGNPNCGKTTLFNMLTDSKQYVGNRPGVTVEKKEAVCKSNSEISIVDLPGVYSLSPFSPEEIYTRDYLINEQPNAIINLIDATHLAGSLYLTTQLLELGIPTVLAINMTDKLKKAGKEIDSENLAFFFGVPVIPICTAKGMNINELLTTAINLYSKKNTINIYPNSINQIINQVKQMFHNHRCKTFLSIKTLEGDQKYLAMLNKHNKSDVEKLIAELNGITENSIQDFFAAARYKYIDNALKMCLKTNSKVKSISQRIDKIVLNRFTAFPIFFAVLFLVYYVCVTLSGTVFSSITAAFSLNTVVSSHSLELLKSINCAEWLQSLIIDGIFSAVGSVLNFLPQIFMLFFALGILEESGYMARIAFLSDRIFRIAGLSGKSFVPLLIGSGCSVPAIMSARTIENDAQRRISIIVTPFIPCSAKMTVITFIASTMFSNTHYTMLIAFVFSVSAVFLSGILLKDSRLLRNQQSSFLMELPSYSFPQVKHVVKNAAHQSVLFIRKAGSIILLSSIVIWVLSSFSFEQSKLLPCDRFENSLLGSLGSMISPFFAPLGFGSSEMSVSVISGIFAKENIIGTLEVLSNQQGFSVLNNQMNIASSLSFLAFNLLCPPCIVAINTIKREMNSIKYTAFALVYQTIFAYFTAFVIFHAAKFLL